MAATGPSCSKFEDQSPADGHFLAKILPPELLIQLLAAAKPKVRSTQTHDNVHLPALKALSGPINCLLLGCSMFERFKTTGKHTYFGPPASDIIPPTSSFSITPRVTQPDDGAEIAAGTNDTATTEITSTKQSSKPGTSTSTYADPSDIPSYNPQIGVFNASCGGDTLKNIIYRLTKTSPPGLLELLLSLPLATPQYIICQAGTNDLGDGKKPLSDASLSQYRLLLTTLSSLFPRTKLCVCGMNPKKRVKRATVIEESNEKLAKLVREVNEVCDKEGRVGIDFLPSDPRIIDYLEEDGVHLNKVGYEIMAEALSIWYQDMKTRCDAFVSGTTDVLPVTVVDSIPS